MHAAGRAGKIERDRPARGGRRGARRRRWGRRPPRWECPSARAAWTRPLSPADRDGGLRERIASASPTEFPVVSMPGGAARLSSPPARARAVRRAGPARRPLSARSPRQPRDVPRRPDLRRPLRTEADRRQLLAARLRDSRAPRRPSTPRAGRGASLGQGAERRARGRPRGAGTSARPCARARCRGRNRRAPANPTRSRDPGQPRKQRACGSSRAGAPPAGMAGREPRREPAEARRVRGPRPACHRRARAPRRGTRAPRPARAGPRRRRSPPSGNRRPEGPDERGGEDGVADERGLDDQDARRRPRGESRGERHACSGFASSTSMTGMSSSMRYTSLHVLQTISLLLLAELELALALRASEDLLELLGDRHGAPSYHEKRESSHRRA